jgi:formylglycine-generating enzyme required for sulfatase activity
MKQKENAMSVAKRWVMAAGFMLAAAAAQAGVTVTNVVIQQRWPWNGLVDIDYEVVTDEPGLTVSIHATGRDAQNGWNVRMRTLSGDGAAGPVGAGRHRLTWDSAADAPALATTNFAVSLQAVKGMPQYVVADLSEGPTPAYPAYAVTYLDRIPEGGWTDEHKTTKLVLSLVKPGVFVMGSPDHEIGRSDNEIQHTVTLTQPFYLGVFEVTQKQWELVTGNNPAQFKGDARPVEGVSYHAIRGSSAGAQWPASSAVDSGSFLGRLRARTPLFFDLPTEAQWEYACRAGTITALNSGMNLTDAYNDASMAEVGRYGYNQSDGKGGYSQHTKVGSYLPNAWGLYDMHGNVQEWCLDWYGAYSGSATDPKGVAGGSGRVLRGGGWSGDARNCRSAYRNDGGPSNVSDDIGLRVLALPAVQ